MKQTKTHSEYLRRINLSLGFIRDHLDQPINLERIAAASHFSPYHFHRIFHAIVGETVNDYVSRLKMQRAANTLICKPDMSVTEVAERGGYSSSANFAKAFKLYFGVSPSQLRDPAHKNDSKIGKIFSKYGKEFDSRALHTQLVTETAVFKPEELKEILMKVQVKEILEKSVAYLTAPKGYELEAIFETWDTISQWAEATGIENYETKRFAIYHDNPVVTPVEKCRYDASIEVASDAKIASPYKRASIPAGKYAVAHYKGEGEKVSSFYMELYSAWLPDSGYEPDDFPPMAHYLNDSRVDGFVELEAYIKLRKLETA